MFPSVIAIPKRAAEDTLVRTTNASGEEVTVHIPKGSDILLDTPGLHYNRASLQLVWAWSAADDEAHYSEVLGGSA